MEFLNENKIKAKCSALVFTLICFSFLGCGQFLKENLSEAVVQKKEEVISEEKLEGQYIVGENGVLNISNLQSNHFVLFFVSDTCSSCREETEELIEDMKINGVPQNVKIVSVLIGANLDDVEFWQSSFDSEIKWVVGRDENLELYKKYFEKLTTPSILIYNKETKILKKLQGAIGIEAIKGELGLWN